MHRSFAALRMTETIAEVRTQIAEVKASTTEDTGEYIDRSLC
jgi:hypothetical protein